jgi:hypothetical protein
MHVREIVKQAIENDDLKQTPSLNHRMASTLWNDIIVKKEKSSFIPEGANYFSLSPYSLKQKRDTLDIGSAGEYLVMSELLFEGFNASKMTVDRGIDIVAIRQDRPYYLQVKTRHVNKGGHYSINFNAKTFARDRPDNYFCVFVLRDNPQIGDGRITVIVLPYRELFKSIRKKNTRSYMNNRIYRVNIQFGKKGIGRKREIYLGSKKHRHLITKYENGWRYLN